MKKKVFNLSVGKEESERCTQWVALVGYPQLPIGPCWIVRVHIYVGSAILDAIPA